MVQAVAELRDGDRRTIRILTKRERAERLVADWRWGTAAVLAAPDEEEEEGDAPC